MLQQKNRKGILAGVCAAMATVALMLGAQAPAQAATEYCKSSTGRLVKCENQRPTITGTPAGKVTVGQAYAFTPSAKDPEGRKLTFSIVNRPPWATFNTTTGKLTGSPKASHVGEYVDIRIRVTDGKWTQALPAFSIRVVQANQAPKIAGTPPTAAREGQAYEFKPKASDADGDVLAFSISNRPAWATFNAKTGRLSGTPGKGTVGTYANIVIKVSDGKKTVSLPAFSIKVEQAAMGNATLSWLPPGQRVDGSALTNLAGYRIYYGTQVGSYPNRVDIPSAGITSAVIENLPPGTYYFVATSYDTAGNESPYSAVVSKKIG